MNQKTNRNPSLLPARQSAVTANLQFATKLSRSVSTTSKPHRTIANTVPPPLETGMTQISHEVFGLRSQALAYILAAWIKFVIKVKTHCTKTVKYWSEDFRSHLWTIPPCV